MGAIAFAAVLVILAGLVLAYGGEQFRKGWEAKRATEAARERLAEEERTARWRVGTKIHGSNTLVVVQRHHSGDPMVIARIAEDSEGYEAELHRAWATARQRAALLNATLDDEE